MRAKMGTVEPASPAGERVTLASTITTWRMRRSASSRILHGAEIDLAPRSNRPLKAAEARGAGERFEFTVAFLFGKGEAGFGIAALGRFVADQKRDRRPLISRGLSGRERAADQGLHQPASATSGQRGDMLDEPVAGATLYPAILRIRAAKEYRGQFGAIETAVACDLLDRRSRGGTCPCRGQRTKRGGGTSLDLGDQELRGVPPADRACDRNARHERKTLRLGPVQRDVEPAARPMAALRGEDGPGDEVGIFWKRATDRGTHCGAPFDRFTRSSARRGVRLRPSPSPPRA